MVTEDGLYIDLSIDTSKNGLDDSVIQFDYHVDEFSDQTLSIQLDFNCPECISSYEVDSMTIVGRTNSKVLFTQDVELPP